MPTPSRTTALVAAALALGAALALQAAAQPAGKEPARPAADAAAKQQAGGANAGVKAREKGRKDQAAGKKGTPGNPVVAAPTDPAAWAKEYPLQYETYRKTVDQVRTKYGGSEALPREPTAQDPRRIVSQQKIEEDPRLVRMWKGYAFAVDFREERGHAYMLEDQTFTKRQAVVKQPGSCLNCHASTYEAYVKLGDGDLSKGFQRLNAMPYPEAAKHVQHPVACIDCHAPDTMELRVTRPAFVEGMRAWKAAQGIRDYDVNRDATQQEMRAFVCGQCHVEYYFKGSDKQLTYPWADGIKVEAIQRYYDQAAFKDWVHADTGAPALKAQHPEFELWNQGIHGRSGVSCVDCHMPEITYKGERITDHHVNSPLLKVEASCTKCHGDVSPKELVARVETEQDRFFELRNRAMDALMALVGDLERARADGRPDAELVAARYLQRRAQFYLDFVEAENSTGFHAPQEALRILGESIDFSRQGQLALRDAAFRPSVAIVEIPTATPGPNQSTAPAPGTPGRPVPSTKQPPPQPPPRPGR